MKNQYFGDRRDLFKYDLLVDLAGCLPDSRLVFIPMLTPNDDSGEGSVIAYGRGSRRRVLFDSLRDAVASGKRNIQLLRNLMPTCGVRFMPYRDADYFQDATRAEYFEAVPTEWLAGSVVFFDPDIGLQTGTAAYMRGNGAEKYLFYADLCGVWARASDDSVFVVYQHLQNDATKRAADVQRRLREAIRLYDRLLLILSEHSMNSEWVRTEIAKARKRELREHRRMLFPVSLVGFQIVRDWECFDADTGKDSAREIREYFIPDFSDWKNHDYYQEAFERLLKDLKAKEQ